MGWRLAFLLVISMMAMPWAASVPTNAGQERSGHGQGGSAEDLSIQLGKEVWTSAETFIASIIASNLSTGQMYTLQWEIRSGNGTLGHDVLIRNGQLNISATNSEMQIQVQANHLNSSISFLHRLMVELRPVSYRSSKFQFLYQYPTGVLFRHHLVWRFAFRYG
ncbi:MAG: hypothetical protein CXX80_12595 [Methanobacteriota archaeon]|nr:MAG: hypothetical protein CXX80_12595 [Euryarchaeota archaeon]